MKILNHLLILLTGVALVLIGCEQEPQITPSSDNSISTKASGELSDAKHDNNISSRTSSAKLFDMNDRFAFEKTGANGFGKVSFTQTGGTIEVKLIQVTGLLPNHEYELIVTVDLVDVYISEGFVSNSSGHWKITNFELPAVFATGVVYRVDLFVTHCHSTDTGVGVSGPFLTGLFMRDPLLSCMPFVNVEVVP